MKHLHFEVWLCYSFVCSNTVIFAHKISTPSTLNTDRYFPLGPWEAFLQIQRGLWEEERSGKIFMFWSGGGDKDHPLNSSLILPYFKTRRTYIKMLIIYCSIFRNLLTVTFMLVTNLARVCFKFKSYIRIFEINHCFI